MVLGRHMYPMHGIKCKHDAKMWTFNIGFYLSCYNFALKVTFVLSMVIIGSYFPLNYQQQK